MQAPPVVFEDAAIIAVAKPAGLATANVPAGEESVFTQVRRMLAARSGAGRDQPFVGVVSRLDRPVSGVVVFAKTPAAAAALARQFRERTVEKVYVAVTEGRFPAPVNAWIEWVDAIERPRRGPSRALAGSEHSAQASLRARVLVRLGEVSLVEVRPATGRRHQIRSQFGARRCSIVGDRLYGSRLPFSGGIALHARSLVIAHPVSGHRLVLQNDPPAAWWTRFPGLLDHLPRALEVDSANAAVMPPPRQGDAG